MNKFRTALFCVQIFLATSFIAMSQPEFTFETAWKKVESALENGKPKSAIEELEKIIIKAKREKNEPQQIKALIYKARAIQQVEEDSQLKNIKTFEHEILTAQEPLKQVLFSLSAGLYKNYFDHQRWKIYDRSTTDNADANRPETWSVTEFNNRISLYYEKSLSNPGLLQKANLKYYDPIIVQGNTRHLRPTLFDLLAHEALDYWKNDEGEITKPVYAFVPDNAALAPAKIFVQQNYTSKDSTGNIFKALRLYQDLIRFHLSDENPDALIDVDIARVQFAYEKAVLPWKSQFYKEALEHIYTQYGKNEQAMQAGNLLAKWWYEKGNQYNPVTGLAEDKMGYAIALEYAGETARTFPKSEGGIAAKQLIEIIKKPSIGLQGEKVNVVGKPFRIRLDFKNVHLIYFRLIKLPPSFDEGERYYEDENAYWTRITALAPIRSWQQPVPQMKDYRTHSAEVKVDGLPNGRYLLIASSNVDFSLGKQPMASTELYVSNISFVQSGEHFFVLHRDNGQPLAGAKVHVWYSYYDYNKRRNIFTKANQLTADENGYLQIKSSAAGSRRSAEMRLEISTRNDYLFLRDAMYRTYDGQDDKVQSNDAYELEHAAYFFFTDRSIYRPGQNIYFKAIGLTKNALDGKPKLFNQGQVELIVRNANFEQIGVQKYYPNSYASFNGNFLLPVTGLTGNFQLEIKKGNRSWTKFFRVEEYKRPKFFVEYKPVKGTYKLNRDITITGLAKGYAGNTIDGAQVVYRVKRSTRFLYPWRLGFSHGGYWPPETQGSEMEIINGVTITKADGTFDVTFTAIPDGRIDPKLDPGFDYIIEAVVTDVNGEVRSAKTTISVGYKSLILELNSINGNTQSRDSALNFEVNATNFNGESESASIKMSVYTLKNPGKLLRKRYWQAPDTSVMGKKEFEKFFPNDPYGLEDDYRNWETDQIILTSTHKTSEGSIYTIKPGIMKPGYYKIEATAEDSDGQEVKTIAFISIFDTKGGKMPEPAYFHEYGEKVTSEPGEQAIFWQGTFLSDAFVIQHTLKKSQQGMATGEKSNSKFEYIRPIKGYQRFMFNVTEDDRGGYAIYRIMVYHSRVYIQQWRVNVPWSNKELSISFETFRDKLLPGEHEKWTVKIKGSKGEQIAAEMLAAMYDASLDQFEPHVWDDLNPWKKNYFNERWGTAGNFSISEGRENSWYETESYFDKRYDQLMSVALNKGYGMLAGRIQGIQINQETRLDEVVVVSAASPVGDKQTVIPPPSDAKMEEDNSRANSRPNDVRPGKEKIEPDNSTVSVRKNFNETAFFFPNLQTDKEGNIGFSFTMPEALTQWRLQLLAHTTDARFNYATRKIVTQKQLMVFPNAPRFLRQGDNLEFSVKISNLSEKELTGQVQLQLLNATTMQPVDGWFKNIFPNQFFNVSKGQSVAVKFPIEIPYLYNDAVVYRIVARADSADGISALADGEEMALPVLTNRMLVTESFPIHLRGVESKIFTWNRFSELLSEKEQGIGLDHHSLTVEYAANPVWYAVQSLPYIMEYPYDCAEQTWNRFYANALAGKIANSSPLISSIFESWKTQTPDALLSNLQKNPELKSALLEETPWVLDAKNEAEQKKNIGLLFDLVRMNNEGEAAIHKLMELQSHNGGFVWFKGGQDDRYMTQYILTGIGHLRKLDAWPDKQKQELNNIITRAIPYADARIKEEYDELIRSKTDVKGLIPSPFAIQYLYMRSFFPEKAIPENTLKAVQFFSSQSRITWNKMGKYQQGMTALALYRGGDKATATSIVTSLTENSITHEEFGMYWKEFNNPGWYWWQAPIESHALLMEVYNEIDGNVKRLDDLKTWLLKQKQTTHWESTKATAEACYSLLAMGTEWLKEERTISIELGNYKIGSPLEDKQEAGTGYLKHVVSKEKIVPSMGNIKVKVESVNPDKTKTFSSTSWGSIYWQYFQDLDKITPAETSVAIKKELYVQKNSDRGPVLERLVEGATLKKGDQIKVRIEIMNDRNMEYVHIKDMRASCFEPVQVLSGYKWQGGLGYYETIKDASSNFFIGFLARGTYIFEYELRVTISGNFSNGITTLQCMYAPGFSTHSEGIRVNVDE